ncbi:hypothetical protein HOY80DRAFT_940246 [Tuber brumale]|nr:hypothetical protein HOY80DRAFT_940246 [Tuber brumale]
MRLCVYTIKRGSGEMDPPGIVEDPLRVADIAPMERWNINLLDQEGEDCVREIVAHINQMCPIYA